MKYLLYYNCKNNGIDKNYFTLIYGKYIYYKNIVMIMIIIYYIFLNTK